MGEMEFAISLNSGVIEFTQCIGGSLKQKINSGNLTSNELVQTYTFKQFNSLLDTNVDTSSDFKLLVYRLTKDQFIDVFFFLDEELYEFDTTEKARELLS